MNSDRSLPVPVSIPLPPVVRKVHQFTLLEIDGLLAGFRCQGCGFIVYTPISFIWKEVRANE